MFRSFALLTVALLTAPRTSFAQTPPPAAGKPALSLKVGDAAPALAIEKWVKGAPVASFEKGKVYVVEFWATWCGPCIASMPHVSALQRQYKDKGVTIIGVTSVDKDNPLTAVEKMVADKGDGMGYTVAWDSGLKTREAFKEAAGESGIPCSFVIDKEGRVAFIGHPALLDTPIEMIVAGTWDIAKGCAAMKWVKSNGASLNPGRNPKAALAKIGEFEVSFPGYESAVFTAKFGALLKNGDFEAASALGNKAVERAVSCGDSNQLNEIAWTIVDPATQPAQRDLVLALKAAESGAALTVEKDAAVLDTLARVWAWKGDFKKALEFEKKAAALGDARFKADIEKALAEYEAKLK